MLQFRLSVALVLVMTLAPTAAHAVCVIMPLDYWQSEDGAAAIFRGTVRGLRAVPAGQIVTFEVDRVWKGRVSKTTVIHNLIVGADHETKFVHGERYLVTPHRQNAETRARFGVIEDGTLGTSLCGVYPPDGADAEQILGNAEGWPPEPDPK
jgi:hypothetical protein